MRILADPNILQVTETFSHLGEVRLKPGRLWDNSDVRQADILLVRSVTRVDEVLLAGSPVRFVGSATAGLDHIDEVCLADREIHFAHAPGSNADAVVDYVLSCLFALQVQRARPLQELRVGVIGVGQVGSRLVRRLEALGLSCLRNDPPRQAAGDAGPFYCLDEVLQADIISLHVPLTRTGEHPTANLLNARHLAVLGEGVTLINAARGGVLDEAALLQRIQRSERIHTVIDCWQGEPDVNRSLLAAVDIATPHIAGYSYDGKLRATHMLYHSLCDFLAQTPRAGLAEPAGSGELVTTQSTLAETVLAAYDVRRDSQAMKSMVDMQDIEFKVYFDRMRKDYPVRREFSTWRLSDANRNQQDVQSLRAVGFKL